MPKVVFSQSGASLVTNDPSVSAPTDVAQLLVNTTASATLPALIVRYDGVNSFKADNNAIVLPVKTTTARDAIVSPVEGSILYNSTTQQLNERRNSTWETVGVPIGSVVPYAGATAPTGWLLCNGDIVPNGVGLVQGVTADYSTLYSILSSTYGAAGKLPDPRGKVALGSGSGSFVEVVTSKTASANAIPVASNNSLWITGKQVVLSGVSGFTGISNGTYWLIRGSSTTVLFASSLANAVASTNLTVTGTGSFTMTESMTTRSLGEQGGEENHAITVGETPAHTHSSYRATGGGLVQGYYGGSSLDLVNSGNSNPTGGSGAHNNMQPFVTFNYIIKY